MSIDVRVQVPSLAPLLINFIRRCGGMADALASGASARKGVRVQVPPSAPWRVFLQHLKRCKNTRLFLFSPGDGGWGVVDDYALSCVYRHLRGCLLYTSKV